MSDCCCGTVVQAQANTEKMTRHYIIPNKAHGASSKGSEKKLTARKGGRVVVYFLLS